MPDQVKLVEREAFVAAAKDGATDGLALRKAFSAEMKAFDVEARTIDFVISTAAVDRMRDSIAVDGWEYDAYLRSPVVLWCHDSSEPPVGKALSVSKGKDQLLSKAEFMSRELSEFADSIFRMYLEKFLSAVSVGFIPKSYTFSSDKGREFGMDFKTQELIEYSCCPVPANPEALVAARAAGIDTEPLREWASKLLDEGNHILVPRNLLEETFRQAKTPRSVRQKFLAKSVAADWKVGALDDLPLADCGTWDGAAAAKRMLDAAGFDGDAPDFAKAARGFLIHDAANPVLRSSYKLPFADIVDGELKAIKSGVVAARSRIDQSDAPAAVRDEAKELAEEYGKKTASKQASLPAYDPDGDGDNDAEEALGMISAAQVLLGEAIESLTGAVDEDDVAASKTRTAPHAKSGRRISKANEALLRKAVDHHESATKCIKDVLASNALEDDGDDQGGDNNAPEVIVAPEPKVLTEAEQRAKRIAEAKALRASVSI